MFWPGQDLINFLCVSFNLLEFVVHIDSNVGVFWWIQIFQLSMFEFELTLGSASMSFIRVNVSPALIEFPRSWWALYTPPHIPTGLLDSYWILLGLQQISYWLITTQIWYPSPTGVLVNSYWNDPKSQEIVDSQGMGIVESSTRSLVGVRSIVGISDYKQSSLPLLLLLYNIKKCTTSRIKLLTLQTQYNSVCKHLTTCTT